MSEKGGYKRYWPMRRGGPYHDKKQEIFKCTECGAETKNMEGWNGSPDTHKCHPGCRHDFGDWFHRQSDRYRDNFDRIFPDSPGAGL